MAGATKVVVFGGNGFVGSNILKVLRTRMAGAVSVSRSGLKPKHLEGQSWATEVEWTSGDALTPGTYQDTLKDATAVIISVGTPPVPVKDVAWQTRMNGDSNCTIIEAAAEAGVPRVVLVNATVPAWGASGYVKGKAMAEACAIAFVENAPKNDDDKEESSTVRGAMVLKPGAIYGTRHTAGGWPIPLAPVLGPVSWALTATSGVVAKATDAAPYLLKGALVPPCPVESLAATAVDGALGPAFAGKVTVLSAFELAK